MPNDTTGAIKRHNGSDKMSHTTTFLYQKEFCIIRCVVLRCQKKMTRTWCVNATRNLKRCTSNSAQLNSDVVVSNFVIVEFNTNLLKL